MKKIMMLILVMGMLSACKDDTKSKKMAQTRAKDDYLSNNKSNGIKSSSDTKKGWGDKENKKSWTEDDKSRFMNECEGEAKKNVSAARANQYCDCMLQKFIAIYPSINELNSDQSSAAKAKMDRLIKECNK